jgi:hypothetical protein
MLEVLVRPIERVERLGMGYKNEIDWGNEVGEDFEAQHKKYKEIIKEILESYDKATNNDLILCFEFWNLMEQIKITQSKDNKEIIVRIQKDKVPFIVVPESIRRARQSLNAQEIGLATNPKVLEMRKQRSKKIRDYFASEKYKSKAREIK